MNINEFYDDITETINMLYQLGNPDTQNCCFIDCTFKQMADAVRPRQLNCNR